MYTEFFPWWGREQFYLVLLILLESLTVQIKLIILRILEWEGVMLKLGGGNPSALGNQAKFVMGTQIWKYTS